MSDADGPNFGGYSRREIIDFLYREAQLADEHKYADWEGLWTDDGIYWVPVDGNDTDPTSSVSFIYDNRARLRTRIGMLLTGERHSQVPPSDLARVISNVLIHDQAPGEDIEVTAAFVLIEYRREHIIWAGRVKYLLRPTPDGLKIALKKIVLVDSYDAIRKLGFIL
ncbi:aromatic-ring-hydroxylating dioxygenase subunit beta [Jatrophihabitans sp.]|uniref:aromatic-ring-hydroxylating dioxygenase subunit beta n=1 Tax=Jatrophihabitans sp. TaxID=1932789 RepID=UPI0030C73083